VTVAVIQAEDPSLGLVCRWAWASSQFTAHTSLLERPGAGSAAGGHHMHMLCVCAAHLLLADGDTAPLLVLFQDLPCGMLCALGCADINWMRSQLWIILCLCMSCGVKRSLVGAGCCITTRGPLNWAGVSFESGVKPVHRTHQPA
jgi:hypothetical protein